MSNEKDDTPPSARRSVLKRIIAGGGIVGAGGLLPKSWKKPVIDSVMLPAHAVSSKGS